MIPLHSTHHLSPTLAYKTITPWGVRVEWLWEISYQLFQKSSTGTRWWYEMASGGRKQNRVLLVLGSRFPWYEMAGIFFRLVRDLWQKLFCWYEIAVRILILLSCSTFFVTFSRSRNATTDVSFCLLQCSVHMVYVKCECLFAMLLWATLNYVVADKTINGLLRCAIRKSKEEMSNSPVKRIVVSIQKLW
jgi:hypothetical protein